MNLVTMKKKIEELQDLVRKTDLIINRLQWMDGSIYLPLLQEWRYAMSHLVNYVTKSDGREVADVELDKAITHVRRSYCDAQKVLIECYIDRAYIFWRQVRNLERMRKLRVGELSEVYRTLLDAAQIRRDIEFSRDDDGALQRMERILPCVEGGFRLMEQYSSLVEFCRREHWRKMLWFVLVVMTSLVSGLISMTMVLMERF